MTVGDGYRTIGYDLSDGVATITLDRPEHMNAFTVRMCLEMIDAFDRVDDDPDVVLDLLLERGRLGGGCSIPRPALGSDRGHRGVEDPRMTRANLPKGVLGDLHRKALSGKGGSFGHRSRLPRQAAVPAHHARRAGLERSLNYFHEPVDTLGVVTGTELVTGTNAHELLAYRAVGSLTHHALVLIAPDLNISWASPNFSRILGYDPAEIGRLNVIELVHPADMDLVLPLAMAVVDDAGEHVERPSRAAGVELPVRVRTSEGRWLPVGITGRVADEEGRLICVLRADPERHALDLVLTQLGTGAPLDDVLNAVVELVRAQFAFDGVLIVHDADGSATSVGEPAMCFNSAELLAELRAEPVFSDSLRAGNNRWIAPITSPGGDHMWGAFVLAAPEGLEPKPFE